ncbi:MAG: hypothetical protein IJ491_00085 [Clostridia bacterium]|nr:hypothetical protein [Clostridia bacterium]
MLDFDEIFSLIAKDKQSTVTEIKNTIEEIARSGLESENVRERHFWLQVPKKGKFPTAEEIVAFLSFIAYHSGESAIMNDE